MRRLLKLFSDLPIARKLLLASVIPVLTVILLSIVTYRSVENFSEDESELNTLYLSQRLAAEYLRLVVDLETGFRGFVITKHEKYLYPYRTAQDHIQAVGISLDEQVRRYEEQRAILCFGQSRQEHARQNCDDRDHDQQFNQREANAELVLGSAKGKRKVHMEPRSPRSVLAWPE